MEWHIVTGSKGGVGKTLLSLFLLARNCLNDHNGTTLVIDLNSMNTDFSRLLMRHPFAVPTGNTSRMMGLISGHDQFNVHKLSSSDNNLYLLMYPTNPFISINAKSFAELLTRIKEYSVDLANYFGVQPIQRVIIDTNYHFCNIFDSTGANNCYAEHQTGGMLSEDNFFIWFMWVAAQLEALMRATPETQVTRQTAAVVEAEVKNSRNRTNHRFVPSSPFMHVISPVSLQATHPNPLCAGSLLQSLWKWGMAQVGVAHNDYTIPSLSNLQTLQTCPSLCFDDWYNHLAGMWNNTAIIPQACRNDPHELFTQVLVKTLQNLTHNERPQNIFPLATIHRDLAAYTDQNVQMDFNWLRGFAVYQELDKMIG
jgi:hypothetical protein